MNKILDQAIFNAINRLAGTSPVLDWIAVIITSFGVPLLGLIILLTRKKAVVLKGLVSFLIATSIELGIKAVWHIPRPDVNALVTTTGPSFPSGHSANAFAIAMTLYFYNRKMGIAALALAVLVGLSRVFVGVHWPSDVLIGAVLGVSAAFAAEKFLGSAGKKKPGKKR